MQMNISDLLAQVEAQGITLWCEGTQLRFRAPRGTLDPATRDLLVAHRDALIAALQARGAGEHPERHVPPAADEVGDLLTLLSGLGVQLQAEGDRLRLNAPRGVVTEEHRTLISQHKQALLARLSRGIEPPVVPPQSTRRTSGEPLPLSHMQQRLWFIKQLDPGNSAYNIPIALRLRGTPHLDVVERILNDLLERHESLRTRFLTVNGEARCIVEASAHVPLERVDLRSAADREHELARQISAFSQQPFNIGSAPLFRACCWQLSDSEWTICMVVDHLVADGISLAILIDEIRRLYLEYRTGVPADLPPLAVQYVDLTAEQNSAFEAGALRQHLDFWTRELAGLPDALQLPWDRPRPPVQTFRGDRRDRVLDERVVSGVRALARQLGATPFMVMLAGFQVLLRRYAGVEDLAVGTAVSNRIDPRAAPLVGFFANNVVLRANLADNPAFAALVDRVRETWLRTMDHQAMPFDVLVDALVRQRSTDHSPLFQVLFVQHHAAFHKFDLYDATAELQVVDLRSARFDLSVDVFEAKEGMAAHFEFNTDLFNVSTIERMLGHFEALLLDAVTRPDTSIDDLVMISPVERRTLLVDVNATTAEYPRERTIHDLFEERAARTPDAIALIFETQTLSYRELNQRANQLAHHLRALGVSPDNLVGVCLERGVDMIVSVLGVLKCGAAYVPLDPAFPKDRIEFMMADAALAVVVTQSKLAESLASDARPMVLMDDHAADLAALSTDNPAPCNTTEHLAYVIYTSGSTGRPKGVMLEHRSVVNFLTSMHREPGITADDRFVSVTTLSFDIAGLEIFGPLTTGGTVVLASRETAIDGVALAALLDQRDATLLQATPATWRVLLDSGWRGKRGLKMLCGGEALPRELAARLLTLEQCELWNMYGPTETTIWSSLSRVTDASLPITIGRPIANTQLYVLDPVRQPVPLGVAGELLIAGDGLARGYLNRDDLTAEKFVTLDLPDVGTVRAYRTGDLVRRLEDGQLEFAGRLDHQVKVRGFRIELGEIESVLSSHPGVASNVVHVREDVPGDQRLVAYVVTADGTELDAEKARVTLRARLPEYMIPNQFVTLESLPLTPNGKVDRKALPAPATPAHEPVAFVAENMTSAQGKVAAIWMDLLRVNHVGLHVNFFDVGGHSLLLVRLQSALQQAFGKEIPLIELFQHTTVAAQANRLDAPLVSNVALDRAKARAARLAASVD